MLLAAPHASVLADSVHWASIITSIGAAVAAGGVIFAGVQVKDARQARRDQMAVELWRRWDEPILVKARQMSGTYATVEEFCTAVKEYRQNHADEFYALLAEPNFLEDLAVLEERGAIDFGFVKESLGGLLVSRWAVWRLAVDEMRVEDGRPTIYENFERLAKKMAQALNIDVPG